MSLRPRLGSALLRAGDFGNSHRYGPLIPTRVPRREPGEGAGAGCEVLLHPQAPGSVPTGSSSVVLAAVLAMLALAGILLGSGVVLLRARAARRSHKG